MTFRHSNSEFFKQGFCLIFMNIHVYFKLKLNKDLQKRASIVGLFFNLATVFEKHMKQNILITRPHNQSKEILEFLQDSNCDVFIEPIFTVQNISFTEQDLEILKQKRYDAIIITSLNAAQNALIALSDLKFDQKIKIFVVGKKTAQLFLKAGYKNVFYPQQENAKNLQKLIIENTKTSQNFLYFCGELITLDFKQELNKYNISVDKIVSYKIVPNQFFSEQFLQEIKRKNFDFALLYSKNSTKIFYDLLDKHNLKEAFQNTEFVCLSEEIKIFAQQLGQQLVFKNSTTFAKNLILNKFYD
ncbi:MAG: uroporphyrinogen-III synthase [Pelagibacterales bacterium]|nr:uroporphyrinogen-III synthase [Pelagibacterales bacterium]